MLKQLCRLLYLTFILSSCSEPELQDPNPVITKLDRLFEIEHQNNRFDGTVTIGNGDSILFQKSMGLSNRMWKIPTESTHRFDICSVNKSFIAALILIAAQEDRLSLNDQLIVHLKPNTYQGTFSPNITIHQLLCHTSGLPDYNQLDNEFSENLFKKFKRMHFENSEYVNFISLIPPMGPPNKQFHYSNFAYHLLTILLEDVYQQSFSDILTEKITKPLNLTHTFSPVDHQKLYKNMAEGYNYNPKQNTWKRNQFIDYTLGRRIFSTSYDLYLWGKEMGKPKVLSSQIVKQMQTNYLKDITPDISYGYGWVVFNGQKEYKMGNLEIDPTYIIHGGATEGYKSMLININHNEYIISFLANTGDQTQELNLSKKIAKILLNSKK